jgi:mycoredoxin
VVIDSILGARTDARPGTPGRLWTAPGRFTGPAAFTTTEPYPGTRQRTTMTDATVSHLPAPRTVTMFTTTWCGYCRRLKSQMQRDGITFSEVDIEREPGTADFVMSVNGGNQTVPTLLFPDGSAATNPTLAQVRARLA